MITAKEREEAFRKDLKELLSKHSAEINIADDGASFGLALYHIEVTLNEQAKEYVEFEL